MWSVRHFRAFVILSPRSEVWRKFLKKLEGRNDVLMFDRCVAERLVNGTMVLPEWYESVTVCFTGLDNFTFLTATCTPHQIVILLNDLYSVFDASLVRHDVYKVESVADSYMVTFNTRCVRHHNCFTCSFRLPADFRVEMALSMCVTSLVWPSHFWKSVENFALRARPSKSYS